MPHSGLVLLALLGLSLVSLVNAMSCLERKDFELQKIRGISPQAKNCRVTFNPPTDDCVCHQVLYIILTKVKSSGVCLGDDAKLVDSDLASVSAAGCLGGISADCLEGGFISASSYIQGNSKYGECSLQMSSSSSCDCKRFAYGLYSDMKPYCSSSEQSRIDISLNTWKADTSLFNDGCKVPSTDCEGTKAQNLESLAPSCNTTFSLNSTCTCQQALFVALTQSKYSSTCGGQQGLTIDKTLKAIQEGPCVAGITTSDCWQLAFDKKSEFVAKDSSLASCEINVNSASSCGCKNLANSVLSYMRPKCAFIDNDGVNQRLQVIQNDGDVLSGQCKITSGSSTLHLGSWVSVAAFFIIPLLM